MRNNHIYILRKNIKLHFYLYKNKYSSAIV